MEKEPKNDGRKKGRKEEKKKRRIGMRNGEKKELGREKKEKNMVIPTYQHSLCNSFPCTKFS